MKKWTISQDDIGMVTTVLEALAKDYEELAKGAYANAEPELYAYLLGYADALKFGRALIEGATKDGDGLGRDEICSKLAPKIYLITQEDCLLSNVAKNVDLDNLRIGRLLGGRAAARILLLTATKYFVEGEDD